MEPENKLPVPIQNTSVFVNSGTTPFAKLHVAEMTPSNYHVFRRLWMLAHAENLPSYIYIDDTLMFNVSKILLDHKREKHNIWICWKDDIGVGFIIGAIYPYFCNSDKFAMQTAWYVAPQYRMTKGPLKLLKAYEEWARLQGCMEIHIGVSLYDETSARKVGRLVEKLGYKPSGGTYIKPTVRT